MASTGRYFVFSLYQCLTTLHILDFSDEFVFPGCADMLFSTEKSFHTFSWSLRAERPVKSSCLLLDHSTLAAPRQVQTAVDDLICLLLRLPGGLPRASTCHCRGCARRAKKFCRIIRLSVITWVCGGCCTGSISTVSARQILAQTDKTVVQAECHCRLRLRMAFVLLRSTRRIRAGSRTLFAVCFAALRGKGSRFPVERRILLRPARAHRR